MKFVCPDSMRQHVQGVFAGQYDVPLTSPPKVVLDIGANVGSFTVWAAKKWDGVRIHAYEPHPDTFHMLLQNVDHLRDVLGDLRTLAYPEQKAVFADGELDLYPGYSNCGCASLWKGAEQLPTPIRVPAISPCRLPMCDFLKIDAEGAELGILLGYPHLDKVMAVALEYHSRRDMRLIGELLTAYGLSAKVEEHGRFDGREVHADRGIIRATREGR